jgi:hypothetical protein
MKVLAKLALGLLLVAVAAPARADYYRDVKGTIYGFYQQYLKRSPLRSEVRGWADHVAVTGDMTLADVEATFLASKEYYDDHGDSPRQWIRGMYRDVLGRQPSRVEVARVLRRYNDIGDRVQVAREFLQAAIPERTAAQLDRDEAPPPPPATWDRRPLRYRDPYVPRYPR